MDINFRSSLEDKKADIREPLNEPDLSSSAPCSLDIPALSTFRNIILVMAFQFFNGISLGTFETIGVLWYIKWGMSLQVYNAGSVLTVLATVAASVLVGYAGDRMKSKYGRRKPFVALGVFVLIISGLALAFPPSHSSSVLGGWYCTFMPLFFFSQPFVYVSFNSWLIESSASPGDYNTIYRFSYTSVLIGGALGVVAGFVFPQVVAVVYALGGGLSTGLLLYYLPNRCITRSEKQPDLVPSFRSCIRTNEFRLVLFNRTLLETAAASGTYMLAFYVLFSDTIAQGSTYLLASLIIGLVLGVIALNLFGTYLKTHDKLQGYKYMTIIICTVCTLGFFTMFSHAEVWIFVIFAAFVIAFLYPYNLLDALFIRDLILFDNFVTGLSRENMYQVAIQTPAQIASQFLAYIPLLIIYNSGFTESTDDDADDDDVSAQYSWNTGTVWQIRIYCSVLVAAYALVAYWSIRRYPFTNKMTEQINEYINLKTAKKLRLEYANNEEIDRTFENEDLSSIADDDEHMKMMHFSALEIRFLAESEAHTVPERLKRLFTSSAVGLALGVSASVALIAGLGLQIAESGDFALFFALFLLITALYVVYEQQRFAVLADLRKRPPNDVHISAISTNEKNRGHKTSLEQQLKKAAIEFNTETTDDRLTLVDTLPELNTTEDPAELKGYKRVYIALIIVLLFAVAVMAS